MMRMVVVLMEPPRHVERMGSGQAAGELRSERLDYWPSLRLLRRVVDRTDRGGQVKQKSASKNRRQVASPRVSSPNHRVDVMLSARLDVDDYIAVEVKGVRSAPR